MKRESVREWMECERVCRWRVREGERERQREKDRKEKKHRWDESKKDRERNEDKLEESVRWTRHRDRYFICYLIKSRYSGAVLQSKVALYL